MKAIQETQNPVPLAELNDILFRLCCGLAMVDVLQMRLAGLDVDADPSIDALCAAALYLHDVEARLHTVVKGAEMPCAVP